jgi:hypothetical protein
MINDALDGFAAVIKDRLRNQLLGAFILFWVTLNWKIPILVLKSALPIESTIQAIDSQYLTVQRSLTYPLLLAILYVLISPWLSHVVFLYQAYVGKWRIRAKQDQELYVLEGTKKLVESEAELELIKRNKLVAFENNQKEAEWNWKVVHEDQERKSEIHRQWAKLDDEYQLKERRMQKEQAFRKKFPNDTPNDEKK